MPSNKNKSAKNKATKEEKSRKDANAAKKALEDELARQQAEAEEKVRLEKKRLEKDEQDKRRNEETKTRNLHYAETRSILEALWETVKNKNRERWEDMQWQRYLRQDYLPDPLQQPQVNTYMATWRENGDGDSMEDVLRECHTCILLHEEVELALIECADLDKKTENRWTETIRNLEQLLQEKLDNATYNILLSASSRMDPDSFNTNYYVNDQDRFVYCLWCNLSRNPKNKGHTFFDAGCSFELPRGLLTKNCAVRIMYTSYDHYSKYSVIPTKEMIEEAPPAPPSAEGEEPMPVIIDPQCYAVVGGVIHVDLLYIPPQAVTAGKWIVRQVENPSELSYLNYRVQVIAARPPPLGMKPADAAEFTEAEVKRFEIEMSLTVLVTLRLPKNVLFLDQPVPVRWEPDKKYWATYGFFENKYEEEKGQFSFKTSQFGVIGVVQKKYPNLPFQSWTLEQSGANHARLNVTGPLVQLAFEVKPGWCCLKEFNYGEHSVFPKLCNEWKSPKHLLVLLSRVGLHLSPEGDAYKFIGVTPKDSPIEAWTYHCMALLVSTYTFSCSRWNALAGQNNIVIKCTQSPNHSKSTLASSEDNPGFLVLVNAEKTYQVKCTEYSQSFNDESQNDTFAGDLYHLLAGMTPHVQEVEADLYDCVYKLLSSMRILSFS